VQTIVKINVFFTFTSTSRINKLFFYRLITSTHRFKRLNTDRQFFQERLEVKNPIGCVMLQIMGFLADGGC
jgi:hypothetical protein